MTTLYLVFNSLILGSWWNSNLRIGRYWKRGFTWRFKMTKLSLAYYILGTLWKFKLFWIPLDLNTCSYISTWVSTRSISCLSCILGHVICNSAINTSCIRIVTIHISKWLFTEAILRKAHPHYSVQFLSVIRSLIYSIRGILRISVTIIVWINVNV